MWSASRILWDQQVLLMWILLPPIFIACGFLVLLGPYLVRKKEEAGEQFIPDRTAMVDRHS